MHRTEGIDGRAVQAIEAGWRDTQQGSLLARSLQRIRQALAPLSLSWQEPPPQAHHVASAALFALCSQKTSRSVPRCHPRWKTVSCGVNDDTLSRQQAIEKVLHELETLSFQPQWAPQTVKAPLGGVQPFQHGIQWGQCMQRGARPGAGAGQAEAAAGLDRMGQPW